NALLHWLALYNSVHVIAINFACTFSLLAIFRMKINPAVHQLKRCISQPLLALYYKRFRQCFYQSFAFFHSVNQMFGPLFLVSLFVFVPANLTFTVWFFSGNLSSTSEFFVAFFICYQLGFIFCVHLILTFCTKLIHRPAKLLIHCLVKNGGNLSLRNRVKLSNDIAALHTTNRYGFTYWHFGLISLAAFAKVSYNLF